MCTTVSNDTVDMVSTVGLLRERALENTDEGACLFPLFFIVSFSICTLHFSCLVSVHTGHMRMHMSCVAHTHTHPPFSTRSVSMPCIIAPRNQKNLPRVTTRTHTYIYIHPSHFVIPHPSPAISHHRRRYVTRESIPHWRAARPRMHVHWVKGGHVTGSVLRINDITRAIAAAVGCRHEPR